MHIHISLLDHSICHAPACAPLPSSKHNALHSLNPTFTSTPTSPTTLTIEAASSPHPRASRPVICFCTTQQLPPALAFATLHCLSANSSGAFTSYAQISFACSDCKMAPHCSEL